MLFEFTFVVEGVDATDDEVVGLLADRLDATLALGAGVSLLLITSDGADAVDAAQNAMMSVESLVPELRFLYLDRDLVGITEIAERTGRSRQNVTQWVTGERHAAAPAPFPRVEGVVGRARIWLWSEVNAWLRMLNLGEEIASPGRYDITNIDFFIAHRDLLARNRDRLVPELVWAPVLMRRLASIEGRPSDKDLPSDDLKTVLAHIRVVMASSYGVDIAGGWHGSPPLAASNTFLSVTS